MSTQIRDDVHKVVSEEVGRRISDLVPSHSRKTAADIIGVRYETLRRWCNGEIVPRSAHLPALAEYLGVTIEWILTGQEKEKDHQDRAVGRLLGHYEKITETNIGLIEHLEKAVAANIKNNNQMILKVKELRKTVSDCKKRLRQGRRKGDPKGFDPAKLRSIE